MPEICDYGKCPHAQMCMGNNNIWCLKYNEPRPYENGRNSNPLWLCMNNLQPQKTIMDWIKFDDSCDYMDYRLARAACQSRDQCCAYNALEKYPLLTEGKRICKSCPLGKTSTKIWYDSTTPLCEAFDEQIPRYLLKEPIEKLMTEKFGQFVDYGNRPCDEFDLVVHKTYRMRGIDWYVYKLIMGDREWRESFTDYHHARHYYRDISGEKKMVRFKMRYNPITGKDEVIEEKVEHEVAYQTKMEKVTRLVEIK